MYEQDAYRIITAIQMYTPMTAIKAALVRIQTECLDKMDRSRVDVANAETVLQEALGAIESTPQLSIGGIARHLGIVQGLLHRLLLDAVATKHAGQPQLTHKGKQAIGILTDIHLSQTTPEGLRERSKAIVAQLTRNLETAR